MVTFRSLLQELLVFCELLRIGEGDAVYPLEGVVTCVAKPVRCGMLQQGQHTMVGIGNVAYLGDHECLDAACMWHMRA